MTKATQASTAQMRKGVLELCILRILRNGEAYTSDMAAALQAVDLLTRMKNAGTLTYRWAESASGPPRKYYSMTPDGENILDEMESAWTQFVDSVNSLEAPAQNPKKN
jgi:PadR family transcriptional regulator PadR